VEGDATRGTTTLVYLQIHISTVHVLSRVAGIHPLVWPPTRDVGRCPQGPMLKVHSKNNFETKLNRVVLTKDNSLYDISAYWYIAYVYEKQCVYYTVHKTYIYRL
jgi:hypothetical protein